MRKSKWWQALRFGVPGVVLLQVTACFGPDPQLFFTSTIANAVIVNVVNLVFNTLTAGLAGA